MNRRVETIKLETGYLTKVWSETAPEAYAVECAAQSVPPPSAYKPNPGTNQPNPGTAFDPEEKWPSDDRATWYHGPPNCDGFGIGDCEIRARDEKAKNEALSSALQALAPAGHALAQAQHEAAEDGDECSSGICLAVRGAND